MRQDPRLTLQIQDFTPHFFAVSIHYRVLCIAPPESGPHIYIHSPQSLWVLFPFFSYTHITVTYSRLPPSITVSPSSPQAQSSGSHSQAPPDDIPGILSRGTTVVSSNNNNRTTFDLRRAATSMLQPGRKIGPPPSVVQSVKAVLTSTCMFFWSSALLLFLKKKFVGLNVLLVCIPISVSVFSLPICVCLSAANLLHNFFFVVDTKLYGKEPAYIGLLVFVINFTHFFLCS